MVPAQDDIPFVGADVYYVAPGSADGRYPSVSRAAKITQIIDGRVDLFVMNPTGTHFPADVPYDPDKGPYTWHWFWED